MLRQILYLIFKNNKDIQDIFKNSQIEGDSNNGYFGNINSVENNKDIILKAFNNIKDELKNFFAYISNSELDDIKIDTLKSLLKESIEKTIRQKNKYGGNYSFTAALAEEGRLPLYGLPIRSLPLIHEDPINGSNKAKWPLTSGIIDRSEDIALAEFAPDKVVIKDKAKIRSIGIGWPSCTMTGQFFAKQITFTPPIESQSIIHCSMCGAVTISEVSKCNECGSIEPDVKLYKGWRPYAYIADIKSHDIYDGNIDVKPTQILSHPNYQTDDHKQISWSRV